MVPSGPAYPNISPEDQVCPVTGAVPRFNVVSGDGYIEASFQNSHSHLWRNYGILVVFFLALLVAYGLSVEFIPQVKKGEGDFLIFLRGGKNPMTPERKSQEKDVAEFPKHAGPTTKVSNLSKSPSILEQRQDVFTWDKLEYQIPIKGGSKTLLTNIHGYVKPETMTGNTPPSPKSNPPTNRTKKP